MHASPCSASVAPLTGSRLGQGSAELGGCGPAALRAGPAPLAVAVERAGRRPRPTAPLPPPAHSAGARGSGQSDAELLRLGPRRRPGPEPAPAGSPTSAGASPGGSPAGKGGQCCWGSGRGTPRTRCGQVSRPDGARRLRPQCWDRTRR